MSLCFVLPSQICCVFVFIELNWEPGRKLVAFTLLVFACMWLHREMVLQNMVWSLQTNWVLLLCFVECSLGHDGHPYDGIYCRDGQCWESDCMHSTVFILLPSYRSTIWHWGCCHVLDKQGMSTGKSSCDFLCSPCVISDVWVCIQVYPDCSLLCCLWTIKSKVCRS